MSNDTLGSQIKEARKRAGLTQAAVAEKMGISVQAVSQWETDRTIPNYRNLNDLKNVIGLTLDKEITTADFIQGIHTSWDTPEVAVRAPVVHWQNSAEWSFLEYGEGEDPFHWVADDFLEIRWKPVGDVFALKINNNLLKPDFTQGDFIIIDTGRAPEKGDVVVVEMEESKRAYFGRYVPMGTDEYRAPIFELHHNADTRNSPYRRIDRENPGRVVGVVREQRRYFRMD